MELLVAVNHNQLRTMASETVDPIDWSHPHPQGQYPLSATCIVWISATSAGFESAASACEETTLPMRPLRGIELILRIMVKIVLSPIWREFIRDKMSIKEGAECSCSNKYWSTTFLQLLCNSFLDVHLVPDAVILCYTEKIVPKRIYV